MLDEVMGVAGLIAKEVEVNKEEQVMVLIDMVGPAASPKPCPQVAEAIMKVREAIYPIRSFQNVNFRELENEHESTHGDHYRNLWTCCSATCRKTFEAVAKMSVIITMYCLVRG